ncbi:MAG: DUF721 domain-containing protein [Betaproteobacteria bacterium]|nr:DUF721 domain-containing protein [Betaproteobacteria bacterium]
MQAPKIDRFLSADADLQPVIAKALEIDALSKLCADLLPPELARIAHLANYKDGRLIFLAANGAAAAKLKLLSWQLCDTLSRMGRQVNSVSVKVQPAAPKEIEPVQKHAHMTTTALTELGALYRELPDSPLRKALKSLLDRHPPPPEPPIAQTPTAAEKSKSQKAST